MIRLSLTSLTGDNDIGKIRPLKTYQIAVILEHCYSASAAQKRSHIILDTITERSSALAIQNNKWKKTY